jgi:hypothetical protein
MKTITLTFKKDGKVVATATARFEYMPGPGKVVWKGDAKAVLGRDEPVTTHYAENFESALTAFAEKRGFATQATEKGEWVECEGDL